MPVARFSLDRLPPAVQLVRSSAGWPTMELPISTTGGYAPVTMTVDAGGSTDLFELAAPTRGKPRSDTMRPPVRGEVPSTGSSSSREPAEAVQRILRFKGASSSTQLPDSISITVTARDGRGSSVSSRTTLYPIAPSIASVSGYEGKVSRQTIPSFEVGVTGLGAAEKVEVREISGCGYEPNPRLLASEYRVQNGAAGLRRSARLMSGSTCSGLRVRFAVKFPQSADYLSPMTLTTPEFQMASRQTYSFSNTWDLQSKLGFKVHDASGVCQGKSEMPTQPSYDVGVLKDAGDITFKIRSGPVGTECAYASQKWVLPDGFELTKLTVSSTRSGPEEPAPEGSYGRCCSELGDGKMCSGMTISNPLAFGFTFRRGLKPLNAREGVDQFQVSGWGPQLLTPDNVILHDVYNATWTTVIPPLMVTPMCLSTLANDQFVTIRIDEVNFSGPPGVTFP